MRQKHVGSRQLQPKVINDPTNREAGYDLLKEGLPGGP